MSFYEESKRNRTIREDRYRNCKILRDKETDETLLSTREISEIRVTNSDKYHQVKSHEVGRLDLIAHQYYRNALLWWVIAEANNIYDPFTEVIAGMNLRVPSLDTLYGYNGILL